MKSQQLRLGLVGCPPGTGNKGVDALRLGALEGLATSGSRIEPWVFGYGRGIRDVVFDTGARTVPAKFVGAYLSRRLLSPSNYQQMLLAARLGLSRIHPILRALRELDAILDVTGGDSFTDMYGPRRFLGSVLPKRIALAIETPLILLPQTYGPFAAAESKRLARELCLDAAQVWARDADSLEVVRHLLGDAFDPGRHRQTWDMGFRLPRRAPEEEVRRQILKARDRSAPLFALNVSGLIYNDSTAARERFGFRADYRDLIEMLLERLMDISNAAVLLVPHVASDYKRDCDARAAVDIWTRFPQWRDRLVLVPAGLSAPGLKWVVGQVDWVCATRMHAAIAGLSQAIPTVSIAYSDKSVGVFRSAGVGDCVVDPRLHVTEELVAAILTQLAARDQWAAVLRARTREIRADLDAFFAQVIEAVR